MAEILGIRAFNRSQRVRVGLKELTTNKTAYVNLSNGRVRRDLQNHSSIGAFLTVEPLQEIGAVNGFVLAGGSVTASAVPDLNLDVSLGVIEIGGVRASFAATQVTIAAADATNPRYDLVTVDSSGAVSVVAGTPAADPKIPTTTNVVLAVVKVPATDTAITDDQVRDIR